MRRKHCENLGLIALLGAIMLFTPGWFFGKKKPRDSEKAAQAMKAGEYEKAVILYGSAISKEGESYALFLNRGKCHAALGRNQDALEDFGGAKLLVPSDEGGVARERAPILIKLKKYSEALADVDEAIEMTGEDLELLFLRAEALQGLKRYDEAVPAYALAARGVPANSNRGLAIAKNTALCLFRLKKYDKALQVYISNYFKPKQSAGKRLSEEDYYWAGALYHVNMQDDLRDEMYSKLSEKFKKERGIK